MSLISMGDTGVVGSGRGGGTDAGKVCLCMNLSSNKKNDGN